jgi:hypothetical protein
MKSIFRFVFIYIPIIFVILLGAFGFFVTGNTPDVVSARTPTSADAARARAFSRQAIDQVLRATTETELVVTEKDVDGLFALMNRGAPWLAGDATVTPGGLDIAMTLRLPRNAFRNYMNLRFGLNPSPTGVSLSEASLGKIRIPGPAVLTVLRHGANLAFGDDTGTRLMESVTSVRFGRDSANLGIRPLPDLKERLMALSGRLETVRNEVALLGDRETIGLYYTKLVEMEPAFGGKSRVSLANILSPYFTYARDRSGFNDPVAENQAALMALAIYLGDARFEKLTGPVRTGNLLNHRPKANNLTLNNRHDLLLHFVISMGLKLVSEHGVAMAIGEFKELLDSNKGGSGFSFVDLGADRTGLKFAEAATYSEASARHLQNTLAGNAVETLFFPKFTDLPENMSSAVFARRFGDVTDTRYIDVVAEIDRRISATKAYRLD